MTVFPLAFNRQSGMSHRNFHNNLNSTGFAAEFICALILPVLVMDMRASKNRWCESQCFGSETEEKLVISDCQACGRTGGRNRFHRWESCGSLCPRQRLLQPLWPSARWACVIPRALLRPRCAPCAPCASWQQYLALQQWKCGAFQFWHLLFSAA